MAKNHDILGIANPFIDYVMRVEDTFLKELDALKGGMEAVNDAAFQKIISMSHQTVSKIAGGSGTNAIKGLAHFGKKCALLGKLGKDEAGAHFQSQIEALGITPFYTKGSNATGHVLCLVTPDGERTMRTYLGSSKELSPQDLKPEYFQDVRLVHIEGYLILNPPVIKQAMQLAKKANALISFDLANFEVVRDHKKLFVELIENYCDIVFANEKEMEALSHEGCHWLSERVQTAVILRGIKGCTIGQESFPTFPIEHPLDTTGAGDLFASGFLHGYLDKKPLAECARLGALTASTVIQVPGAEIPPHLWEKIKTDCN